MPGEPTTVTGLELPVLFPDPGPLGMRGRTQRGQFHHQAQGFCHSCLRNAASRHPADGAHRASGRDPCRLGAVAPGSPGPVRPFHLAAVELHAPGSCSGKRPACEEGAAGTAHPQRAGPGRGTRRRHLDLLSRRRGGERGAALWGGCPVRRVGSETTGRVPRGLAAPLGAVGKSHAPELGSESTRVSGLCLSPCTASCALRAAGSEGQLWNLHIAASACLRGLRASPCRPERTPLLHAHFPPPGTSTRGTAFLTSPHSRLRCVICWLDLL